MSLICNVCQYEASTITQLAGHRSGHVRRGELVKKTINIEHQCTDCRVKFSSGHALGGHKCYIGIEFDNLPLLQKRKRVLSAANHSCTLCGFNEKRRDGASVVQIDHIDGDKSNNTIGNLRVLCPNCHAVHSEHFMFYGRKHVGDLTRFITSRHSVVENTQASEACKLSSNLNDETSEQVTTHR